MDSFKIKKRNHNEVITYKEDKSALFLYNTFLGRLFLKLIIRKWLSVFVGKILSTRISKIVIPTFIKKNNINMNEYETVEYNSFNDFFTRKIKPTKRTIIKDKNILISPCDAKLMVYEIDKNREFKIKESYYKVYDLINNELANEYEKGYALIFRLCVDDYHRYSYIDNGYKDKNHYIKGVFHAVRPVAISKFNVFKRNSRQWTILHTENFGDVIQIDVGALNVGKIVNHHEEYMFKKGDEKGYFEFGGSTIVLLFKERAINIDQDILSNSKENIETEVKLGEQIGEKN